MLFQMVFGASGALSKALKIVLSIWLQPLRVGLIWGAGMVPWEPCLYVTGGFILIFGKSNTVM